MTFGGTLEGGQRAFGRSEQRVVNALFVNEEGGTKTKRPGAFCAESAEDDAASLF
jgi:hypothetical protein